MAIEFDIDDSTNVRWSLDFGRAQSGDPIPAKLSEEETELEDDVLSCSRLGDFSSLASFVVCSQEDDREGRRRGIVLEFLDDRSPSVRLAMQNDGADTCHVAQEEQDFLLSSTVMAMNEENCRIVLF